MIGAPVVFILDVGVRQVVLVLDSSLATEALSPAIVVHVVVAQKELPVDLLVRQARPGRLGPQLEHRSFLPCHRQGLVLLVEVVVDEVPELYLSDRLVGAENEFFWGAPTDGQVGTAHLDREHLKELFFSLSLKAYRIYIYGTVVLLRLLVYA